MSVKETATRREFLKGRISETPDSSKSRYHVSSAVIAVLPARRNDVLERLQTFPNTEISAHKDSRIVIVMEGDTSGELGARLAEISLLDGVISANMVFEQSEVEEE